MEISRLAEPQHRTWKITPRRCGTTPDRAANPDAPGRLQAAGQGLGGLAPNNASSSETGCQKAAPKPRKRTLDIARHLVIRRLSSCHVLPSRPTALGLKGKIRKNLILSGARFDLGWHTKIFVQARLL